MEKITVCGIQIESRCCDIDYNINKAVLWIEKCVHEYAPKLIVFPETAATGFDTSLKAQKLNNLVDEIPGKTTKKIMAAAKKFKTHILWTTYERAPGDKVYNSAVLISSEGNIIGVYRKIHPFPTELEWTLPGEKIGIYNTPFGKVGVMICYDGDFPELARIMGVRGVRVIARPSAFLRSFDTWKLTNTARAYDSRAYIIATNVVGRDGGLSYYYGHSMIVSPLGRRIAQGLCREEIIYAELDPEPLKCASYGSDAPMISNNIALRKPGIYKEILEDKNQSKGK